MSRSKREIPHYYLAQTISMARAVDWLTAQNAADACRWLALLLDGDRLFERGFEFIKHAHGVSPFPLTILGVQSTHRQALERAASYNSNYRLPLLPKARFLARCFWAVLLWRLGSGADLVRSGSKPGNHCWGRR